MRSAKIIDTIRKSLSKQYKHKIRHIEFKSHSTFKDDKILLKNPTVIIGRNGAGKSRLLKIIKNVIDGNTEFQYDYRDRFDIEVELGYPDGIFRQNVYRSHQSRASFSGSKIGSTVYISPFEDATLSLDRLSEEDDFSDLIEQTDPYIYSEKDLGIISTCYGKQYRSISSYYFYDLDKPFRYFIVDDGKRSYDSSEMGMGELCLLTLFQSIKESPKSSFVFIDEPENSLMYLSQERLVLLLSSFMLNNDNFFIISTHSLAIVNSISQEYIYLLYEIDGMVFCKSDPLPSLTKDITGLNILRKIYLYVEDSFASQLLSSIIYFKARVVFRAVEIVILDSESNLQSVVKSGMLRKTENALVVFDGDSKSRIPKEPGLSFLPGEEAPEKEVFGFLSGKIEEFCDFSNIEREVFRIAFFANKDTDHHEKPFKISESIDLSPSDFIKLICDFYAYKKASDELEVVSEIKKLSEFL